VGSFSGAGAGAASKLSTSASSGGAVSAVFMGTGSRFSSPSLEDFEADFGSSLGESPLGAATS
jgi:hypothetical protein